MFERFYLETNGKGYWSNTATEVEVEDLRITYVNEEKDFGELCVYFDTGDWDTSTDRLIYTDPLFLQQLRAFLNEQGFAGDDVSYSEQGMQGDNYVSLDVGGAFINSFNKLVSL